MISLTDYLPSCTINGTGRRGLFQDPNKPQHSPAVSLLLALTPIKTSTRRRSQR